MNRILSFLILFAPATALAAEPEVNRKLLKPGLIATFTEQSDRPKVSTNSRLEPTVALYLKPGEGPSFRGTVTAAKWTGYVQIVTAGPYQFSAVYQGGTPAVTLGRGEQTLTGLALAKDKGSTLQAQDVTGPAVQLEPGVYALSAKFDPDLSAEAKEKRFELQWQGPGFRREPIPNFFFGHLPEQRKETVAVSLPVDHGRFLFEEYGCKNCHHPKADDAIGTGFVNRTGPDLSEVGKRVYPGWLDEWLADPKKLRPHTTMPKLFTDDDRGHAERYAVGQYLTSLGGPLALPKVPTISNEWSKSIDRRARSCSPWPGVPRATASSSRPRPRRTRTRTTTSR